MTSRSSRYYDTGRGRPIVLIHAFPLSADQWQPVLETPPDGVRLIAPNLRGFRGLAEAPRAKAEVGTGLGPRSCTKKMCNKALCYRAVDVP